MVFTAMISSAIILVAPFDRDGRMIQSLSKWWGRNMLRVMRVPLEVQGLEHLTPGQAYVYAANHRSDFDIFTLLAILPGRIMFVAKNRSLIFPSSVEP
jgi:1-acyl-sn-glycerol-3-phosphate acyltransferase